MILSGWGRGTPLDTLFLQYIGSVFAAVHICFLHLSIWRLQHYTWRRAPPSDRVTRKYIGCKHYIWWRASSDCPLCNAEQCVVVSSSFWWRRRLSLDWKTIPSVCCCEMRELRLFIDRGLSLECSRTALFVLSDYYSCFSTALKHSVLVISLPKPFSDRSVLLILMVIFWDNVASI